MVRKGELCFRVGLPTISLYERTASILLALNSSESAFGNGVEVFYQQV